MRADSYPERRARLLSGAQPFARWVLAGGPNAPRAPWGWRWQIRWHATWSGWLAHQQLTRLTLAAPRQPPVLVLGFWRSGTTLLHERLSALPGHQSPRTWQCFAPSTFALTGPPRRVVPTQRRPMDNGNIDAFTPQEDEFALLLQGAPSLYRGFADPRRLLELAAEHFEHPLPDDSWVPDWLRFLAGVETQGGSERLVLKSPNHTLRLTVLQAAMPDSPQVWIGRPLREVWWSNQHMWRTMFDRYALWPCPEQMLDAFLKRCVEAYIASLRHALLDASPVQPRRVWVDFGALMADGLCVLRALTRALRLGSNALDEKALEEAIERHPAQNARTVAAALPDDIESLADEVDALHAQARQVWAPGRINGCERALPGKT